MVLLYLYTQNMKHVDKTSHNSTIQHFTEILSAPGELRRTDSHRLGEGQEQRQRLAAKPAKTARQNLHINMTYHVCYSSIRKTDHESVVETATLSQTRHHIFKRPSYFYNTTQRMKFFLAVLRKINLLAALPKHKNFLTRLYVAIST